MSPDPRTIRRALEVVQRLPPEALADLAERIIDCLDATESDPARAREAAEPGLSRPWLAAEARPLEEGH